MILPSGVNKATGLQAALDELGLARANTVGVGDAENDHAFLAACGCGVAVAGALPALREKADLVTAGDAGEGVEELCERLVRDDLAGVPLPRLAVPLGGAEPPPALTPFEPALLTQVEFVLEQQFQKLEMTEPVGGRFLQSHGERLGEAGEPK